MKGTIIFDLEGTLVDSGGKAMRRVFIDEGQLQQLAKEYELAIVTGALRQDLAYVLAHTFLGGYIFIEKTVTKDDCCEPKATGKPFQKLLERGFTQPVVIIGDSEGDRLGAEVLSIPFVHVETAELLASGTFDEYIKDALDALSQF